MLERSAELDLAQTPVVDGRAMAVVGEGSRTVIPAALTWVARDPPAALEVALVVRALYRSPALDRLLGAAHRLDAQIMDTGYARRTAVAPRR